MHQSRVNLCGLPAARSPLPHRSVHASEPREPLRRAWPARASTRGSGVHASEPREPLRRTTEQTSGIGLRVSMHQSRVNLCGEPPPRSSTLSLSVSMHQSRVNLCGGMDIPLLEPVLVVSMHQSRVNLCGSRAEGRPRTRTHGVHASEPREPLRRGATMGTPTLLECPCIRAA